MQIWAILPFTRTHKSKANEAAVDAKQVEVIAIMANRGYLDGYKQLDKAYEDAVEQPRPTTRNR